MVVSDVLSVAGDNGIKSCRLQHVLTNGSGYVMINSEIIESSAIICKLQLYIDYIGELINN